MAISNNKSTNGIIIYGEGKTCTDAPVAAVFVNVSAVDTCIANNWLFRQNIPIDTNTGIIYFNLLNMFFLISIPDFAMVVIPVQLFFVWTLPINSKTCLGKFLSIQ